MRLSFAAPLWLWSGKGSWHFVTVPPDESMLIRMATPKGRTRGWGSLRVQASVGDTMWRTSIFPDSKSGTFLLPVKADVRKAEALSVGDTMDVTLSLDL